MSRYAVYEFFNNGRAPNNLESCGHLAGALIGESDKNPLDCYNKTYYSSSRLDKEIGEKSEDTNW